MPVNWHNLIVHRDSKQGAFEELCCQLFSQEYGSQGEYRRISPPDMGIECCIVAPDGFIRGMQAKYFSRSVGDLQAKLSLLTAALEYQNLVEWKLSIYVDRSNPDPTAREWPKLDAIKADLLSRLKEKKLPKSWKTAGFRSKVIENRNQIAATLKSLKISYWTASQIEGLLSKPESVGKRMFWFGELEFDRGSLKRALNSKISQIKGNKYLPELHVPGKLDQTIEDMLGSKASVQRIRNQIELIRKNTEALDINSIIHEDRKGKAFIEKFPELIRFVTQKTADLKKANTKLLDTISTIADILEGSSYQEALDPSKSFNTLSEKIDSINTQEVLGLLMEAQEALVKKGGLKDKQDKADLELLRGITSIIETRIQFIDRENKS